jgi:hypothetical protein
MDFLKKHYEKLILGIVLVGLAGAVAFLPFKISKERQDLEDLTHTIIKRKIPPLTNLDLTIQENALKRMGVPALVDFSTSNKLFNPMTWMQTKDTPPRLLRKDQAGPVATVITNITPLYLKLSLEGVNLSADSNSASYVIGITKEASPKTSERTKKTTYCRINEKKDKEGFILVQANGPLDNPTNVVLELLDTGEKVTLTKESKDVPYKRIDGYAADISYPPEHLPPWKNRRVGDMLRFNNEEYKIVAINPNELVLSANSNQKKWTIKANPTL